MYSLLPSSSNVKLKYRFDGLFHTAYCYVKVPGGRIYPRIAFAADNSIIFGVDATTVVLDRTLGHYRLYSSIDPFIAVDTAVYMYRVFPHTKAVNDTNNYKRIYYYNNELTSTDNPRVAVPNQQMYTGPDPEIVSKEFPCLCQCDSHMHYHYCKNAYNHAIDTDDAAMVTQLAAKEYIINPDALHYAAKSNNIKLFELLYSLAQTKNAISLDPIIESVLLADNPAFFDLPILQKVPLRRIANSGVYAPRVFAALLETRPPKHALQTFWYDYFIILERKKLAIHRVYDNQYGRTERRLLDYLITKVKPEDIVSYIIRLNDAEVYNIFCSIHPNYINASHFLIAISYYAENIINIMLTQNPDFIKIVDTHRLFYIADTIHRKKDLYAAALSVNSYLYTYSQLMQLLMQLVDIITLDMFRALIALPQIPARSHKIILRYAIKCCRRDLICYLLELRGCAVVPNRLFFTAIKAGNVEILQSLLNHRIAATATTAATAIFLLKLCKFAEKTGKFKCLAILNATYSNITRGLSTSI